MERTRRDGGGDEDLGTPSDDLADDLADDAPIEMANLDSRDTDVPGTIFVSTARGADGPA